MNKFACIKLLSISTERKHNVIVFDKHFKDDSVWSEAVSNNISTKVFDYNEHIKEHPEDAYEINNELGMITKSCSDLPMIRCKDFTVALAGQKVGRMEKFVGKVNVKYDEDYNLIHVWFSTIDNDNNYIYLGCINKFDLEKYHGVSVIFAYKD